MASREGLERQREGGKRTGLQATRSARNEYSRTPIGKRRREADKSAGVVSDESMRPSEGEGQASTSARKQRPEDKHAKSREHQVEHKGASNAIVRGTQERRDQ